MTTIKRFDGKYRWLSNFAPCHITDPDGLLYPSVENYYQANKTLKLDARIPFQTYPPGQAKRAGRKLNIREDWNEIKEDVMEYGLRQKYNQDPYRGKIAWTGNRIIQEGNTWNDTFWGICAKTNVGQNKLGKLLMKIRSEIQDEERAKGIVFCFLP